MAGDVNGAIAKYLQLIQESVIWPALAPSDGKTAKQGGGIPPALRPDKLALFRDVLIKAYRRFVVVFEPVTGCVDDDDCDQTERCRKGVCTPISGVESVEGSREGSRCVDDDDCDQTERCIKGVCVPIPFDLGFAEVSAPPTIDMSLRQAMEVHWARIHEVITKGLAADGSKLETVRDRLMQTYAEAAAVAGQGLTECKSGTGCSDVEACVNGFCVPIPFRLVFKARGGPLPAPWI
jgi:hypothetical protein